MTSSASTIYRRALERRLDALGLQPDATLERARELVTEAIAEAEQDAAETLARALHQDATRRAEQLERRREQRERDEAGRERTAQEFAKVAKRLYGAELAAKLEPFQTYALITHHGQLFALRSDEFEDLAVPVIGGYRPMVGQRVAGSQLPRKTRELAGVFDDVDALVAELRRVGAAASAEAERELREEIDAEIREQRAHAAERQRELAAVDPDRGGE